MRLPIKFNRAGWPYRTAGQRFFVDDPRPLANGVPSDLSPSDFSDAISTLQFGVTFKTTRPGRQQHSNRFISRIYAGAKPIILEVGASDGITSLDLIRSLGNNFGHYFVTDLNLSARWGRDPRGVIYFLDYNANCVLRASKRFITYSDVEGAPFPLPFISRVLLSGSRKIVDWHEIMLIQPELLALSQRDCRISIERYDLFRPWTGERPDLIKVANLLNARYFTDSQMKEALKVQCRNLAPGGRLLLVSEDDDIERFSVFVKSPDAMVLEYTHGAGAKASPHVPFAIEPAPGVSTQFVQETL